MLVRPAISLTQRGQRHFACRVIKTGERSSPFQQFRFRDDKVCRAERLRKLAPANLTLEVIFTVVRPAIKRLRPGLLAVETLVTLVFGVA
jgi:hypothetical protein